MSEHVDKLRRTLDKLQEELRNVESLDPESRSLLENAMGEMDTALHRGLQHGEESAEERQTLADQFREVGQQFDESHPTISRIVGNLIDVLGQMGI